MSHCTSFILVLLFSIGPPFSTPAQHAWAKVNSSLVKFDSNCASTDVFREADLAKVLPRALKHAPEDTKIQTYRFRKGGYAIQKDHYAIGDPSRSLDIQTGPAHKMPKKLLDARKACVKFGE